MNYFQYRFKTLLIFLMLSSLFSQKILHMNGTYDLDGDNMLEFLALELDPDKDVFPTAVRFYEIDSDGYQTLIWEFIPPVALEGEFVDAQVGDIDGDGSPDLILVMNLSRFADNATPHVFVATYSWDGSHFSEIPSATLSAFSTDSPAFPQSHGKSNHRWNHPAPG